MRSENFVAVQQDNGIFRLKPNISIWYSRLTPALQRPYTPHIKQIDKQMALNQQISEK